MTVVEPVYVCLRTRELSDVVPEWLSLGGVGLETDPGYFLTLMESLPNVESPYVMTLRRDDGGRMLIVARISSTTVSVRLGYRTLLKATGRALVLSFDGVVGARTEQDWRRCVRALLAAMEKLRVDVVVLPKVGADSLLSNAVREAMPSRRRRISGPSVKCLIDVPDDWEQWLGSLSSKTRKDVRYYQSRLVRRFGERLSLQCLDDLEDAESLRRALEAVDRTSYQADLGIEELPAVTRDAVLSWGARTGQLRTWVTLIDGEAVSYWWGLIVGATLYAQATAYDAAYTKDRVGSYTFVRMIQDCCADSNIDTIDLGFGDAAYKQRFATRQVTAMDLMVFGRRPRGWYLRCVAALDGLRTRVVESRLGRGDRAQALKTRLRSRGLRRSSSQNRVRAG